MLRMLKWLLIGAVAFLVLYASAIYVKSSKPQIPPPPPDSLSQTSWILQDLAGSTGFVSPPQGTTLTAQFLTGKITGSGGCNTFSGTYIEGENQTLTISKLATTMMACDPPVMELESQYLTLLEETGSFSIANNQLTLLNQAGQTSMVYNLFAQTSWENTPWSASGINNGKSENAAVVSTATTSKSTAIFQNGTVSGNGGCNQYSGPYQSDGNTIKIGPLSSNMMACDPPLMDQETQFLSALEKSNQIESSPDKLILRENNATMVSFVAAPSQPVTVTIDVGAPLTCNLLPESKVIAETEVLYGCEAPGAYLASLDTASMTAQYLTTNTQETAVTYGPTPVPVIELN